MLEKGLVHSYYGNGKGKTTAAVGLGVRAAGSGLKVCMIQFLKTRDTGEINIIKRLEPDFRVFRLESPKGFFNELNGKEKEKLKQEVAEELELARKLSKECDVLILDEIFGAMENKLLEIEALTDVIKNKAENLELILTGRVLPDEIKNISDYVSEIREVKHPCCDGVPARKGIEY